MPKPTNPKKIYFSGSLHGVKHKAPEFSYKLVHHMQELGFNVLSEHVAARTQDEQDDLFLKHTGIDRRDPSIKNPWMSAYKFDMGWVDEADYLIAVVDGPSHGVGMEVMRAVLKEERGLPKTEILCLVNENRLSVLSWMLRGVPKKYDNFRIKTYTTVKDAIKIIDSFLTR